MNANHEKTDELMQGLLAKARTDESFKQRLLADPTTVLKAEGVTIPDGMTVEVVENSRSHWTLVLAPAAGEELSDEDLEKVAGGPMPFLSDSRLKTDISLLERRSDGLGLYRYRYLWSDTVFVGVMAQEVAEVLPEAVTLTANGFLAVDYARLGLRLMTLAQWTAARQAQPA